LILGPHHHISSGSYMFLGAAFKESQSG